MQIDYYKDYDYQDLDPFISSLKHQLKSNGPKGFVHKYKENPNIQRKVKRLYLIALIEHVCNINNIQIPSWISEYTDEKMDKILFPEGAIIFHNITGKETMIKECYNNAIKKFKDRNIIETEIDNVY